MTTLTLAVEGKPARTTALTERGATAATTSQPEPLVEPTTNSARRLRRIAKRTAIALVAVLVLFGVVVAYSARQTEADIAAHHDRIASIGTANPAGVYDPTKSADVPAPVQRYFDYTFVNGGAEAATPITFVELTMAGDFRRPLTEGFSPTTAEQTIAVGTPALMFSARTTMFPGVWARAYDAYAEGRMEMKAKVMSTLAVVDESETPELNQTSLRRWLLESPLYPAALLPGGDVRWEAIDETHARAIVAADGQEASLVATFRANGSLESFDAEIDGDLTTPYHGSGEHVSRDDDRLVSGMMIPHSFMVARAADGETFPFWKGEIESIIFHTASEAINA